MTIMTITSYKHSYEEIMQFIQNLSGSDKDHVSDVLVDDQFLMSYGVYNTRTDITIYNGPDYEKNFSTKAANFEHFDRESFERLLDTSLLKFLGIDKNFEIKVGGFYRTRFEVNNIEIPVTINDLLDLMDQKAYRSSDLDIFVDRKTGKVSITI